MYSGPISSKAIPNLKSKLDISFHINSKITERGEKFMKSNCTENNTHEFLNEFIEVLIEDNNIHDKNLLTKLCDHFINQTIKLSKEYKTEIYDYFQNKNNLNKIDRYERKSIHKTYEKFLRGISEYKPSLFFENLEKDIELTKLSQIKKFKISKLPLDEKLPKNYQELTTFLLKSNDVSVIIYSSNIIKDVQNSFKENLQNLEESIKNQEIKNLEIWYSDPVIKSELEYRYNFHNKELKAIKEFINSLQFLKSNIETHDQKNLLEKIFDNQPFLQVNPQSKIDEKPDKNMSQIFQNTNPKSIIHFIPNINTINTIYRNIQKPALKSNKLNLDENMMKEFDINSLPFITTFENINFLTLTEFNKRFSYNINCTSPVQNSDNIEFLDRNNYTYIADKISAHRNGDLNKLKYFFKIEPIENHAIKIKIAIQCNKDTTKLYFGIDETHKIKDIQLDSKACTLFLSSGGVLYLSKENNNVNKMISIGELCGNNNRNK